MRFFLFAAVSSTLLIRRTLRAQQLCKGGKQCTFEEVCKDPGADTWKTWQQAAASLHVQGTPGSTVDLQEEMSSLKLLGKVGGGRSGSAMMMSATGRLFLKSLDVKSGEAVEEVQDEYYKHIKAAVYDGTPSFLSTIGLCELKKAFKVGKKGDRHKYMLIMTNLREQSGITQSFDLKGSKWKNLAEQKKRRCDDEFVRKCESEKHRTSGRADVAEGEDVDFVSMRSPGYRHYVTDVDNEKCWPVDSSEKRFASEADADSALSSPMPQPSKGKKELAGTPLYFPAVQYAAFWAQLKQDIAFLRKHGLMDYSLVINVIPTDGLTCPTGSYNSFPVVQERQQVVIGIIDFYTKYGWYKSVSNSWQSVLRMFGKKASKYKAGEPFGYDTVDEDDYAKRFERFFGRWIRSCKTGPDSVADDKCCGAP